MSNQELNIRNDGSIPDFPYPSPLLQLYKAELHTFVENGIAKTILDGLYYIIPQTAELMGKLTVDRASGHGIDNYSPVITSFSY